VADSIISGRFEVEVLDYEIEVITIS
jgi:hypothetical protein